MKSKHVDLVHYVKGERVVIGKAVVEFDGCHLDITAKITHDDGSGVYQDFHNEVDLKHLSIEFDRTAQPREAQLIPPLKFKKQEH